MDLQTTLAQAFANPALMDYLKEALDVGDIQINSSGSRIEIRFTRPDKLESLLLQPQRKQVAPTRRRTKRGVQHVAGYVREEPKPDLEELIQAQDEGEVFDAKVDNAFRTFIETALGQIDGNTITSK